MLFIQQDRLNVMSINSACVIFSTGTSLLPTRVGVKQDDQRHHLVSPGWAAVLAVMLATQSPRVVTFNLLITQYMLREDTDLRPDL